jgi:hypothetical protein
VAQSIGFHAELLVLLAAGAPLITSILSVGTSVLTSLSAIVAPVLTPFHPGCLGFRI